MDTSFYKHFIQPKRNLVNGENIVIVLYLTYHNKILNFFQFDD